VWRYDLPTTTTTFTVQVTPADALVSGAAWREREKKYVAVAGPGRTVQVRVERPGCRAEQRALRATGRAEAVEKIELDCKKMAMSAVELRMSRKLTVRIDGIEIPKTANWNKYPLPAGNWTVNVRGARGKTDAFTLELPEGQTKIIESKLK
jgi:hypothetical protein